MYNVSLDSAEDSVLLTRLSEGSKPAFDAIYNRYWKLVYQLALKRLNDSEKAQDVAQDVFVQLWTRGSKSVIENLPAYLLISSRNGVFKVMEKEARLVAVPVEASQDFESPFDRADSAMLHREFLDAFNKLVEALPDQQRLIFKMRFEEDLSSQQIADALNISPKTVRNQIGKVLSTLRQSLLVLNILIIAYSFH
ncbi:MAG: sigma-70 family RNA polymerase sigma factor [Pedobacter sp.]